MSGKRVFVYNETRDTLLALHVRLADSFGSRVVGLLRTRQLPAGAGLWIIPCNSIHTVGMRFPIDLILVDRSARVVAVREYVRPFRMTTPVLRAHSALELAVHSVFRSRTRVGDQLRFNEYELTGEEGEAQISKEAV